MLTQMVAGHIHHLALCLAPYFRNGFVPIEGALVVPWFHVKTKALRSAAGGKPGNFTGTSQTHMPLGLC